MTHYNSKSQVQLNLTLACRADVLKFVLPKTQNFLGNFKALKSRPPRSFTTVNIAFDATHMWEKHQRLRMIPAST